MNIDSGISPEGWDPAVQHTPNVYKALGMTAAS